MLNEEQIAEEYESRCAQYAWLRYLGWGMGLLFIVLMVDLFSGRSLLMKAIDNGVDVYLFVAYIWGNLYIFHSFFTEKLGRWNLVSFPTKVGIFGWNLVCLGHLLGFIKA